ncbi:MAG: phenylalanine--tRNA ligase subunit beta [Bacteroidota bacterium]|nr:phenylalanine--tRNA ligase subunit beta [Bacteroidota bacterium]MDX5506890.1 phenylalanine--tRNA ligase subunit beta [Bacteroidota bacterium]
MKVSYNWIKELLTVDIPVEEAASLLTDTGLEVEGVDRIDSVEGGLEGVVVGQVLTCEQHPNADRLKVTTVDVGTGTPLHIVCGAPNVDKGQKVLVATVGSTLYPNGEPLKIKKGKIRGEVSEGMICAEDELGLGTSHDGIMILADDAPIGVAAADYLELQPDHVIEIGLTPNRSDAMSHYGVARDLKAALKRKGIDSTLDLPSVSAFKADDRSMTIPVEIRNKEACPNYMGVTLSGIEVKPSPNWLQEKLRAIGLSPINNVVDATNYVLHEIGHPLHAFDADKIKGSKVIIDTVAPETRFTTLDEKERTLSDSDLMIQNEEGPMCIAGVFGGLDSGVTETTQNIFIESAWFNPVWVRKTAKRHGLNTDASFRYERGVDPRMTEYALKRVALLIKEIAGGKISSEIVQDGKDQFEDHPVTLNYRQMNRLIGQDIPKEDIYEILQSLEIRILAENGEELHLAVPPYRMDVTRPADVIEEILRIYGYNHIEMPDQIQMTVEPFRPNDPSRIRRMLMENLVGMGFYEIQCLSLTKEAYYNELSSFSKDERVNILNPLSQDLNVMRQTMLFGGLETISRNISHKRKDLMAFELGKTYFKKGEGKYEEIEQIALWVTGNQNLQNWSGHSRPANFFYLKSTVMNLGQRLGLQVTSEENWDSEMMEDGLTLHFNGQPVFRFGLVKMDLLANLDIEQPVYYAEGDWQTLLKLAARSRPKMKDLPRFPIVKRDLALLLDMNIRFNDLQEAARKTERKLLSGIELFDVYTGDKLPEGKKSYAISFYLSDPNKTLTDNVVDRVMDKMIKTFESQFNAKLRS